MTAYRVWQALGKGRDPTPNEERGKYLTTAWNKARRMGYTADEFAALPRWVVEAGHSTGEFLKAKKMEGQTKYVFRHEHLDERLSMVREWLAGEEQAPAVAPTRGAPLINGAAAAWSLVTGWVNDIHVGTRTRLPADTPAEAQITGAFSAAGGRHRYERERNLEPMMLDFARHLGVGHA